MAACLHSGVPEAPLHQVLRNSSPQEHWIQAPARGLQQDLLHQGYKLRAPSLPLCGSWMGRVLVAGGISPFPQLQVLYTPAVAAAGVFAITPATPYIPGYLPVLVLLEDGRILMAGGSCSPTTGTNAAAIYNPTTGSGAWTLVGAISTARIGAKGVLLPDGRGPCHGRRFCGCLYQLRVL